VAWLFIRDIGLVLGSSTSEFAQGVHPRFDQIFRAGLRQEKEVRVCCQDFATRAAQPSIIFSTPSSYTSRLANWWTLSRACDRVVAALLGVTAE
jgi:hypothetical protein